MTYKKTASLFALSLLIACGTDPTATTTTTTTTATTAATATAADAETDVVEIA